MQVQKTYVMPGVDGEGVKKTLATPTPERLLQFLGVFGKKSFRELSDGEGQAEYGFKILEIALNPDDLRLLLNICLAEGSADIELTSIDTRLTDEIVQDFFEQRARRLRERVSF